MSRDYVNVDALIDKLRKLPRKQVTPGAYRVGKDMMVEVFPIKKDDPSLGWHWRVQGTKRWKRL